MGLLKPKLDAYLKVLGSRVERSFKAMAETLKDESRLQCPQDTTILEQDAHTRKVEGTSGLDTIYVVGYGTIGKVETGYSVLEKKVVTREPAEYAVYVHEDPKAQHSGDASGLSGRGFKYLEIPMLTKQAEMRQSFNQEISR